MLRSLGLLSIRRGVRTASTHAHPTPAQVNRRVNLALAASAAVGTYLTWRWTSDSHTVHAEAPVIIQKKAYEAEQTLKEEPEPTPFTPEEQQPPPAPTESESTSGEPTDDDEDATAANAEAGGGGGGGAYNPVTGEINWDCPCLGGMAHGTCGPEFRAAFECFVHSEDEPKGINCVDKFKNMQTCFREHPDEYPEEVDDEDEEELEGVRGGEEAVAAATDGGETAAGDSPAATFEEEAPSTPANASSPTPA